MFPEPSVSRFFLWNGDGIQKKVNFDVEQHQLQNYLNWNRRSLFRMPYQTSFFLRQQHSSHEEWDTSGAHIITNLNIIPLISRIFKSQPKPSTNQSSTSRIGFGVDPGSVKCWVMKNPVCRSISINLHAVNSCMLRPGPMEFKHLSNWNPKSMAAKNMKLYWILHIAA